VRTVWIIISEGESMVSIILVTVATVIILFYSWYMLKIRALAIKKGKSVLFWSLICGSIPLAIYKLKAYPDKQSDDYIDNN
jgi:hypothetical protein